MDRRNDRGQATRRQVVVSATRLFADQGYTDTSIEDVLRASGVSRGALYHHFSSKEALFTAALEAEEARVAATVAAAAEGAVTPLAALRAGCGAWLDLARDPVVRRIVLIDAPSVVGWQAWREIDGRHGLGLLKAAMGQAAATGRVPTDMVETYAHLLLAMLVEMALLIARASDPDAATRDGRAAVERMLAGLIGAEPDGVRVSPGV